MQRLITFALFIVVFALPARAGVPVQEETVSQALAMALAPKLGSDNVQIEFSAPLPAMLVARPEDASVAVLALDVDARSGRFSAVVRAPAGDNSAPALRISGRASATVTLATLNRDAKPGEIIAIADIAFAEFPALRAPDDALADAAALIGTTPKRRLRAGDPIRGGDVKKPIAIHKGDVVTVKYEIPGLMLTATGRALSDAAIGDRIDLANDQSHRNFEARVVSASLAIVGPNTALPALAANIDGIAAQ